MNLENIKTAFAEFLADTMAVESAIDSSTTASFSGSGYSVELFNDGTFRVLWNNNIGNLYNTSGVIISIPALSEDMQAGTSDNGVDFDACYDDAIEALEQRFDVAMDEIENA